MKTQKLAVGSRVQLAHPLSVAFTAEHEKGLVTEANEGRYTVKLEHGGIAGGLTDDDIEPVSER